MVENSDRWFGIFDYQVILAGFCGGIGRGVVEGPFEYIKVRRQVSGDWKISEIFKGSGATILRNTFLFSTFVVYMDISKLIMPLSPFFLGSICANLAWLTIWPLDVAKSQLQSGKYEGKSFTYLLQDTIKTGTLFRGIVPGLLRSTIANGTAMVAYKKVEAKLHELKND